MFRDLTTEVSTLGIMTAMYELIRRQEEALRRPPILVKLNEPEVQSQD